MKLKNLKIATQLKLGFAVMLFLVALFALIAVFQTERIHMQTATMYNHPLQVRKAIGSFRADVLTIQRDMKDILLSADDKELAMYLNQIEVSKVNAFKQIDIIYLSYLGPRADVDSLQQAFIIWNSIRDETIRLLRVGKKKEVSARTRAFEPDFVQAGILLTRLKTIDDFATRKADFLYDKSKELDTQLTNKLVLIAIAILILSFIVNFNLLRSINKPIDELTLATQRFHQGDLNARSSITSENEFGILAASFNKMVANIQQKTDLDEKFAALASLMLSEYDIKKFFQATLNSLAEHTGSQMAAIYLLSDDKKNFNHFESIGIDNNARQSFDASNYEGEFGAVLSTRKVYHIKIVPDDTRFIFHTVSGKFTPREIITLPIVADNEVVAVISLSSINTYNQQSVQLIDRILITLCARVEGILAYHKMKEFSAALELQNRELDAQKTELASQSAELTIYNTELEMQKNQLGEANRLKTVFLSNMSHELRTPLNSVIALSGVLNRRLSDQIPEEEYSYLEVIERNGKHLLDLINDILDISRIESGHEEVEISTFNLCNLVDELVSLIEPMAIKKNIELFKVAGVSECSITSDVTKCRHILQNLISNAVKFTETGKVEIKSVKNEKNIAITITDTGIGIAQEHLLHIFDEFRQADNTTSRRYGGTGLGLAIAKKYANLLGGTVSVESQIGKGSAFTLTLPLYFPTDLKANKTHETGKFIQPAPKKKLEHSDYSTNKTILLVDDSAPAIIQIKDILEECSFDILTAQDGAEALDIIANITPDAMILDLMMPGIDGFKVLETLREADRTAHVPVLILTAKHISKEELTFLKRNNIHQLIQKGDVNRTELMNAVMAMVTTEKPELISPPKPPPSPDVRPVVLIVEDNVDNLITTKALLIDTYTVLEAMDGNTGVEMAVNHLPNLILMDIALPGIDGIEAFKAIRRNPLLQHVPIVALTASAMTSDRETILAHGFDAYIAKPIDEKTFIKTINTILYGN